MQESITQVLENDTRTTGFSLDHVMNMVGLFEYHDNEINTEFVIFEKQAALSRSVGTIEIVEDSNIKSGIYMPILYKSDKISIGKTIELTIGNHKLCYVICGFFNSIMAGSHNCNMCGLLLTEDKYQELKETGYAEKATLCSVRIKEKTESENFEAMLKNAIASQYPYARTTSNSYTLVSQSRYISQMICSGIMGVMAFLILLIALVVIASNITNYIQENMKNIGALKAIGYTSSELIHSLLLQFLELSLIAAVIGIGISYYLFPFVNTMMISQTGIPYEIHFLPLPLLLTLVILNGAVVLTVWMSSGRLKKTEPITALRQGIKTHSFQHNYIPLQTTKAPLSLALALKTTLSSIKYNLTICITMPILSLIVVFSVLIIRNVIIDKTPFIDLIVGETADSCININAEIENDFLKELTADSRVEKVYLYNSIEVRHVGNIELLATIYDDFSKVNNQGIILEGRAPKFDNEIAIGKKYAKEKGLEIGNEITITAGEKKADYLISGFTQISNMLGKDCLLTRQGYERLNKLVIASYYLNLKDGTDIDAFNTSIEKRFGNGINAVINITAILEGSCSVYISLMIVIVIAVLILSVIIITFVLYLLVRTMLGNKKRDYGILKAIGFTTGQLILQTALSFMPAIIVSTILGITGSSFIINPLMALFLNNIGIMKCTFLVPVGFIIISGAGLILLAFFIACLLSLKIKKIFPKTMLTGE